MQRLSFEEHTSCPLDADDGPQGPLEEVDANDGWSHMLAKCRGHMELSRSVGSRASQDIGKMGMAKLL